MKRIRELLTVFVLAFSTNTFAAEAGSFGETIGNISKMVDSFFNDYTGWFVGRSNI
jgi:AGCS family alanine or glycine:cation symporter